MAAIDTYFSINNIDFDSILVNMHRYISSIYKLPSIITETRYFIPANSYAKIDIDDKDLLNIYDVVMNKKSIPEITSIIDATITTDEATISNYFIYQHGRYLLVKSLDTDAVISVRYANIPKDVSYIYEEIYRYIKQIYYYSYTNNWNEVYNLLTILSDYKKNVIAKNTHTQRDRRSKGYKQIKAFDI